MKKLSRLAFLTQAIIGVAGCATISIAIYVTKSATPLWALILVALSLPKLEWDSDDYDDIDDVPEDDEQ